VCVSWVEQVSEQATEQAQRVKSHTERAHNHQFQYLQHLKHLIVLLQFSMDKDAHLFESPADLLCPIAHEVFFDPVINSVGQVMRGAE
jgi:hypothetical protein